MSLINNEVASNSSHRIEVTGFNSRVVGSTKPFHTVYFDVKGDSIYYADRVAGTKSLSRKIVRKDGMIYFRYNNYKYDLSIHNLDKD